MLAVDLDQLRKAKVRHQNLTWERPQSNPREHYGLVLTKSDCFIRLSLQRCSRETSFGRGRVGVATRGAGCPGTRCAGETCADVDHGKLWLFGGWGMDAAGAKRYLADA